jgi:hypothetical protein
MRFFQLAAIFLLALVPLKLQAQGCARASWAVERAAALRGLPVLWSVGCQVLPQKEYLGTLKRLIARDLPAQRLRHEERLFKLLGLIPERYPYARCLVESYAHQAAAFYSADTKSFVIPDWIPADDSVLVHEATHALQDQHFDLTTLDRSTTVASDRSLALGALIEGDAMTIESAFLSTQPNYQQLGVDEKYRIAAANAECALPPAMEELFYFQYEFGAYFIARIQGQFPMDELFRNPPMTTSEIMHPSRYPANPVRSRISTPRITEGMARQPAGAPVYVESLGEFITRILLRQFIPTKEASAAASGWGADRIALYEEPRTEAGLVGWQITLQSVAEAQRMYAAISEWLSKRFSLDQPREDLPFWATNAAGQQIRAERAGQTVRIFIRSE